jgi:hypothetical protein
VDSQSDGRERNDDELIARAIHNIECFQKAEPTALDVATLLSIASCASLNVTMAPFRRWRKFFQLTFNVFRRPESRPTGRRRAFRRLSQAFTFTARGGKARSAAAENVC